MDEILEINNVHGYLDKKTGVAYLNAEDVAKGFGFTRFKGNTEYVRWDRVNSYLNRFGAYPRVGKGDFLPENIVYRLGFKANNETAHKFQSVLADDILPTIRKTGGYIVNAENMTDSEIMAKALMIAQQTIDNRNKRIQDLESNIAVLQPKADFHDAVVASQECILIRELAKLIKQNGVNIGEKRLFKFMRNKGYLIKQIGTDYNEPTQFAMNLGVLTIEERPVVASSGFKGITRTTKVTLKGQVYFIHKFTKERDNIEL